MAVHQEAKTIEAFEKAVRAHEFMGARPPEEWPSIEQRFHRTKSKLYELLGLTYARPEEDDE